MNYNFKDRTGERYENFIVLRRIEDKIFPSSKMVQWLCKCDCGKTFTVLSCNFKKIKSCGCKNHMGKNLKDLTGKVFTKLKVLYRGQNYVTPSGKAQTMWVCQCQCGAIVKVRGAHLKDGMVRSCGCIKSFGEETIAKFLSEKHISFKREYTFPNCLSSKGNPLKFDFVIYENNKIKLVLEYQGEQHFRKEIAFGKLQREETDLTKKDYCEKNNIPLFYITYKENIEEKLKELILQDNTVPSLLKEEGVTTSL